MRDLILAMSITLDSFVCGPDGEADWIFSGNQEAIAWKVENVWDAGLHIMGSRTFRDMASFWPTATGPFSPPMNQIPKAVFSKQGQAILKAATPDKPMESQGANVQTTQLQPGAETWAQAYVATGDLAAEVAKLKAQDGKRIVAHGGARFARSLIAHNLVDEYMLLVYPIVLGKGMPIFTDLPAPRPLKLINSRVFPSGSFAQIYRSA